MAVGAKTLMDGANDIGARMADGIVTAGRGYEVTKVVFGAVHRMTVKTANGQGIVLDDGLDAGIAALDIGRPA